MSNFQSFDHAHTGSAAAMGFGTSVITRLMGFDMLAQFWVPVACAATSAVVVWGIKRLLNRWFGPDPTQSK